MERFTVRYSAGQWEGFRRVYAEDAEHAIAKVRLWVRENTSLPMYAESYKIEESEHDY